MIASPYAVFSMPQVPQDFPAFSVQITASRIATVNNELMALLSAARTEKELNALNDLAASLHHSVHNFSLDQ